MKCRSAGRETLGIRVLVHRHPCYCVNAVEWFCQEPLFCRVSAAAGLAIRRYVPDIIKPVTPVIWERRGKKTASAGAKVFSSCSPSFSSPGSPCALIHCSWVGPSRLGAEASHLLVLPAGRLPQTVVFFLLSRQFREEKTQEICLGFSCYRRLCRLPTWPMPNSASPHHSLLSYVSP